MQGDRGNIMNEYKNIEFFWEKIDRKNLRKIDNNTELKILKDNKIKEFDESRWLTHKDDLLHLLNIKNNLLLSPGYFDLNRYDIMFGEMIGNENAYELLKNKIFYIYDQQIYDKNKRNELDDIVDQLKDGNYGKIDESDFSFIEIYPYIISNTFSLRDEKARKLEQNKEYDDNYGGRCLSLLSIKKILIENISIYESTIQYEEERLGTTNLKEIMIKNSIPRNDCLSKGTKIQKTR